MQVTPCRDLHEMVNLSNETLVEAREEELARAGYPCRDLQKNCQLA